jgi:hypothetical protein
MRSTDGNLSGSRPLIRVCMGERKEVRGIEENLAGPGRFKPLLATLDFVLTGFRVGFVREEGGAWRSAVGAAESVFSPLQALRASATAKTVPRRLI